MTDDDEIPLQGEYRGVGIHADQPVERIEAIVKPEIDRVMAETDAKILTAYCGDVTKPPEARLLAQAKLEAEFQLATAERRERSKIDLLYIRACTAGLASRGWRSRTHYCSMLDVPRAPREPGPWLREVPLRAR